MRPGKRQKLEDKNKWMHGLSSHLTCETQLEAPALAQLPTAGLGSGLELFGFALWASSLGNFLGCLEDFCFVASIVEPAPLQTISPATCLRASLCVRRLSGCLPRVLGEVVHQGTRRRRQTSFLIYRGSPGQQVSQAARSQHAIHKTAESAASQLSVRIQDVLLSPGVTSSRQSASSSIQSLWGSCCSAVSITLCAISCINGFGHTQPVQASKHMPRPRNVQCLQSVLQDGSTASMRNSKGRRTALFSPSNRRLESSGYTLAGQRKASFYKRALITCRRPLTTGCNHNTAGPSC